MQWYIYYELIFFRHNKAISIKMRILFFSLSYIVKHNYSYVSWIYPFSEKFILPVINICKKKKGVFKMDMDISNL